MAQAGRVVMAHGSAGTNWEELKDKQPLALPTELRSNRLNRSGMNKIVRSTSATLAASEEKRACSNLQSLRRPRLLCLVADNPCLLKLQYGCVCVLSSRCRRVKRGPPHRH